MRFDSKDILDPSIGFDFDESDGNQGDAETRPVYPGDTFVVQMFGRNLAPFKGYQVMIFFDETRIAFTGHRPTPLFGAKQVVDVEGGRV